MPGDGESKEGPKATTTNVAKRVESSSETDDREHNLADFMKYRVFRFLHYYAGRGDPLGTAIRAEAAKRGMDVRVTPCEKEDGVDLLKAEPFKEHCDLAGQGHWDGFHAGFPCTSFSRLRWRKAEGYPGPCRSKRHPYGLPTNTPRLQRECDDGTVHASRSVMLGKLILGAREGKGLTPAVTLENPPPSDLEEHLSAWELPEVKKFVEGHELGAAYFATCKYQRDLAVGMRYLKPQAFKGSLLGLAGLSGSCPCGSGARHLAVVGKERSASSASYPVALCQAYAKLLLDHFERVGTLEYYQRRAVVLEKELQTMPTAPWSRPTRRSSTRRPRRRSRWRR